MEEHLSTRAREDGWTSRTHLRTRRSATSCAAWLDEHLPKFLADWGGDEDPGGGRQARASPARRSAGATGSAASTRVAGPRSTGPRTGTGARRRPCRTSSTPRRWRGCARPGIYNANGIWQIGPMIIAWGTAGAAAAVAARDPLGRRALVPGLQRAAGRLRPRQPPHDGGARRRRVRRQRPEDLDLHRAPREVGPLPAPHRPRGDRARRQARGHHRVHHRHGDAGHRVPADPRHRRRRDVQRGLVHRRPDPRRRTGSATRGRAGRSRWARSATSASARPGWRSRWRPTCGR